MPSRGELVEPGRERMSILRAQLNVFYRMAGQIDGTGLQILASDFHVTRHLQNDRGRNCDFRNNDRADEKGLDFLPLYQDAANPSPGQGWDGAERKSLKDRSDSADAVIALAFVHHIAIGRNVPLDRFVDWLVSLAPAGVVEFVPKGDAMVQRLLALRKDIFPDYTPENFNALIARRARIVSRETVTASGRTLFTYDRR